MRSEARPVPYLEINFAVSLSRTVGALSSIRQS